MKLDECLSQDVLKGTLLSLSMLVLSANLGQGATVLTLTDAVNPVTGHQADFTFEEAEGGDPDTTFFWQTAAGA